MPFGMVSVVGRGISVVDGGGDYRRRRDSFGVNLGHSIVTNRDFAMRLFPSYFGQDLFSVYHNQISIAYIGENISSTKVWPMLM